MNTRGLMELIVLNIGLDMGVISPALFAHDGADGHRHDDADVADYVPHASSAPSRSRTNATIGWPGPSAERKSRKIGTKCGDAHENERPELPGTSAKRSRPPPRAVYFVTPSGSG